MKIYILVLLSVLFLQSCKSQTKNLEKNDAKILLSCTEYFKITSYCDRLEFFQKMYKVGINNDCLGEIISDLSEKTLIDANVRLSTFGIVYSSKEDYKKDIDEWAKKLNCNGSE